MNEIKEHAQVLRKVTPVRLYATTVLKIARHSYSVSHTVRVLDLADELQREPEILVVGVTVDEDRIMGIIRRDRLFALIGKPFGREVLQRSLVSEVTEQVPTFSAHTDVFAVAQSIRSLEAPDAEALEYYPLTADDGTFQGILAAQDLANHLARMTQDDIELAGRLQERLLTGEDLAAGKGCRVEAWSRAAKGVGGDFYFTRELPGGKTFATLCDVSGKGVAASLIVSMVWGLLQGYDFRKGLRELVINLNKSIVTTFHMEKYLTGFFVVYNPATRRLLCADMGHSHAMLLRGGKAHALRSKKMNLPIGIEPDIDPAIQALNLNKGDILLAYSDGIIEQEDPSGKEFGLEKLVRSVLLQTAMGKRLKDELPAQFDAFRGPTPQQDDMSFLLLEVT